MVASAKPWSHLNALPTWKSNKKPEMKKLTYIIGLTIALTTLYSCEEEGYDEMGAVGLWKQVSVTEDGIEMNLAPEQQNCRLLLDANGVSRYYHQAFQSYNNGNGPTEFNGTWSMLEGTWMNLTTDKWQLIASLSSDSNKVVLSYKSGTNIIDTLASVQKQWRSFHIQSRFTILKLTNDEMEIRLKTFVGEKKYAMIFAPHPADFLEMKNTAAGTPNYIPTLVTDQNYWTIKKEFQTLKTYVYKFRKETY
jgi:hypothetical protein